MPGPSPGRRTALLLRKGYYFKDQRDIDLISKKISSALSRKNETLDNIGVLNKSVYNIAADEAYRQGGQYFQRRVQVSRTLLGFSEEDSTLYDRERTRPMQVPSANA